MIHAPYSSNSVYESLGMEVGMKKMLLLLISEAESVRHATAFLTSPLFLSG